MSAIPEEVKEYRAARAYIGMVLYVQKLPWYKEYFDTNPQWHINATIYATQVISYGVANQPNGN